MAQEITSKKKKNDYYKNRLSKIIEFKDLQKLSQKLKKAGKKIVFTTGSFDLMNPGHCRYLAEAKAQGDVLVLGVTTDAYEKQRRGEVFPLIACDIRMEMMSFLKCVDYILSVDDDRAHGVLALLQPDVYFTSVSSWDQGRRDGQEAYLVRSYGGKLIRRKVKEPYINTEMLIDHIANIRVLQILEDYLKEKVPGFELNPDKHLQPVEYGDQKPAYKGSFNSGDFIVSFSGLTELSTTLRKKGKTIAFVSGSYDLLHVGHARFIEKAGLLADVLVVGIPSDRSIRQLKGVGRPVISENSRAYVLAHLYPVDYVVIFDDKTVLETLDRLKPDVFFTVSEDWNNGYKESKEYKLVKSYGGEIVTAGRQAPHVSASNLINKVASFKVREIFRECMKET